MTQNGPPGYTKKAGICMNMEQPFPGSGGRHRSTASYGYDPDREAYMRMSPRDALARDIRDARRVNQNDGTYTPEIRQGAQETIQKSKQAWPGFFDKPKPP